MAGRNHSITKVDLHNPDKYHGPLPVPCRSSWEVHFVQYCDTHPDMIAWAYEPIEIPYHDPITGKQKIYIPDFLINYRNAKGEEVQELVEVKPAHEQLDEHARNDGDRLLIARNRAKWEAASWWCQRHGCQFRIMNETNIFSNQAPKVYGSAKARALKNNKAKPPKKAKAPRKARKPR